MITKIRPRYKQPSHAKSASELLNIKFIQKLSTIQKEINGKTNSCAGWLK